MTAHRVHVPPARVTRWFENFERTHGRADYGVDDGALVGRAADGCDVTARLPFDRAYDGPPDPSALLAQLAPPSRWGVLLVRKGGFAVALMAGDELAGHKVGQRHVQGRTKAGGQSQQRFARRRDNQARSAFAAAADHAVRVLDGPVQALVTGGDHAAVDAVLADPRLAGAVAVRTSRWLPVPDPRRAVLDQAVLDAQAVEVALSGEDARH